MNKNIVIQEGGQGKQLTADKLETNLVNGGTCLWVPEDETVLGTKIITKNGTYKASNDGYYGYSEVTVNGIGKATGTGPDGETHTYREDGNGGITDTIVPDSIAVVTPPTVTTYADGAAIDFSGMVVKAYLKSGNVWSDSSHPNGVIPISELRFPITQADASDTHGATIESDLVPIPFGYGSFGLVVSKKPSSFEVDELQQSASYSAPGVTCLAPIGSSGHRVIYASPNQGDVCDETWSRADGSSEFTSLQMNLQYTYAGKTVYYGGLTSGYGNSGYKVSVVSPDMSNVWGEYDSAAICWTMIFGTQVSAGGQTIPVKYMRDDGKIIESSFTITVTAMEQGE